MASPSIRERDGHQRRLLVVVREDPIERGIVHHRQRDPRPNVVSAYPPVLPVSLRRPAPRPRAKSAVPALHLRATGPRSPHRRRRRRSCAHHRSSPLSFCLSSCSSPARRCLALIPSALPPAFLRCDPPSSPSHHPLNTTYAFDNNNDNSRAQPRALVALDDPLKTAISTYFPVVCCPAFVSAPSSLQRRPSSVFQSEPRIRSKTLSGELVSNSHYSALFSVSLSSFACRPARAYLSTFVYFSLIFTSNTLGSPLYILLILHFPIFKIISLQSRAESESLSSTNLGLYP